MPQAPASPHAVCPICRCAEPRQELATRQLVVLTCPACRHRVARHATVPASKGQMDYHEQYEGGAFLASLEATRRRQARRLVRELHRLLPEPGAVVDFGAGRGFFLAECHAAGLGPLAGLDSSALAVELLAARGLEARVVPEPADGAWHTGLGELSFRPRVLTFLDVLEHLPSGRVAELLATTVAQAGPELELVVVKVPSSSGFLYRTASLLARLGATGLLDQLYQVGTVPPHLSYFSPRSLRVLLGAVGLRCLTVTGDRDFEPGMLRHRARALASLPAPMVTLAGWGLAGLVGATHGHDSAVAFAVPRRAAAGPGSLGPTS